ncbi:hypothetical protein AciM339_0209 [Aciduliprofundum sp. MAR08-339]|uniref:hypothetical protein n=1 Tax=Aciduliprofundum sp. (strain MAR08-339) TaxID=673860 RepID=UPI0002A480F2|nr:hypothetical protein AciM339_0177 [Aciduliprofundum sp. MAR08-339]AGB04106.1 hypothetical protein AciM339_0209 [Aciduliprofundum sp. MAR08-339]
MLPDVTVPEGIVQRIIDDIFVNEVDHRPDLMYVEYETVHTIVRLTILRLERLGVFDRAKLNEFAEVSE